VLVAGGFEQNFGYRSSAEVFSPTTNTFSSAGIGAMGTTRESPAAAPLPDGRVLVASGQTLGPTYLSSAEVFNPSTNTFSSAGIGAMSTGRVGAAAAPLPDGRVLVAGGTSDFSNSLSSAEVFDPVTNTFSSAGIGAMGSPRRFAAAAPLPDGRVLLAGGRDSGGNYYSSAEVFVPEPEPTSAGVDFGSQTVAQPSALHPLIVTNLGAQALRISGSALGGASAADYSVGSDGCRGRTLAFEQSCVIQLRFIPSTSGPRPATLALTDNASTSPQSFPLAGTGVAANSGPQGPAGATGPAGPQGAPGHDATVNCKKKRKRVKCTVSFTASSSATRASARLSRGQTTFARGNAFISDGEAKVPLLADRAVPAGRYLLTVKVSYDNGKTAVTRRKVAVG
jgi:hypothetical protein